MDRKTIEKRVRDCLPLRGTPFLTRLIAFSPLWLAACASLPEDKTLPVDPPPPAAAASLPAAASVETRQQDDMTAAREPGTGKPTEFSANLAPPADLWARLRAGFRLPKLDSPLVARHEQWFVANRQYMRDLMERARLYLFHIVEEVEKRGMPSEIALLPAIESAYKPYAYSRARAAGLWQFIPSTGRRYGLKMNWWYDGRRDVMTSTRAALDYLEKLYSDFDGDWFLALAAYNAGEGRVMRAIEHNRRRGRPTSYEHLTQLKWETRHYVPKLMAMVNIVSDPARYGIELATIPNEPFFAQIEVDSQVDLGVVARLTGMSLEELTLINPGLNRWATDPDGPHSLLVPVDKKDAVLEGLQNLPETQRVQWRHHAVQRGETLHELARRYGVSVQAIRSANALRSTVLRVGQNLMIPISARPLDPVIFKAPRPVLASKRPAHGQPIIHRVQPGDTLWSIARRYGVLIRQIVEWNLLDPNEVLRLGQRLRIWHSGSPSAAVENGSPRS